MALWLRPPDPELCLHRAAAVMWSSIASSGTAIEKVLPTLLGAMEEWPVHGVSTSDDTNTGIFALAATLALWHIIQEPECEEAMISHAPHLLLSLLFQISMSTEQMSEEVDAFWTQCQEEHGLPTNPSRFAVQTLKALLCRLHWENEVVAIEQKCGWETLLCPDTHHYAVGLLAREMRRVLVPFHCEMAIHLLGLLSREEPHWELPALAFLVEILDCVDGRKCNDTVLPILSRNLQSLCPERQRLALRGLLVLSVDPLMADSICSLAESLLELLRHEDVEMVEMTLSVFLNMLQDEDLQAFGSAALKLAEELQPLFDNDNSHVQLLSIRLFREVMELVVEEGKETLVHQSLVPLLFHCHDETQCVAEVPAIVRYIHQCLTFHLSPDVRQHIDIRRLADRNPHEVVMTLLGCAPECDRAAAVMWRSIASSGTAVEKVLPTLLGAMDDWPVHSADISNAENNTGIFSLAATLALWHIIQEPKCKEAMTNHAPHLLLSLLFQISMSTEQMSEEVNAFWRQCQEEHGLPNNSSRFAVQTLKALLCRLHWENEVVAIEQKRGWETLLCPDTHHYAVGLLA
ncbi:maestro heat-like repeat-containing protein family member 7, partial [Empidonax traillii]|uniref:maestro heat-like repeat-containing protein family member 7 n=1 Tax=Empidonax traillii TaxID=164674 RepID=UPI000FFD64E1